MKDPNPDCSACNGSGVVPICTHNPPCDVTVFGFQLNEMPCMCTAYYKDAQ